MALASAAARNGLSVAPEVAQRLVDEQAEQIQTEPNGQHEKPARRSSPATDTRSGRAASVLLSGSSCMAVTVESRPDARVK